MTTYAAPLGEMRFVLDELLDAPALFARLGFADATPDVVDAVLEEGARFAQTVLAPLNKGATGKAAATTPRPARSPRPRVSATPTRATSRPAGPAWSRRRNMAARACRTCSASPSRK